MIFINIYEQLFNRKRNESPLIVKRHPMRQKHSKARCGILFFSVVTKKRFISVFLILRWDLNAYLALWKKIENMRNKKAFKQMLSNYYNASHDTQKKDENGSWTSIISRLKKPSRFGAFDVNKAFLLWDFNWQSTRFFLGIFLKSLLITNLLKERVEHLTQRWNFGLDR